jgi:cell division protein FtsB
VCSTARKKSAAVPPGRLRPRAREKSFLRRRDLDLGRAWKENRKVVALVILAGFTVLVMLAAVFGEQGVLRVRHLRKERLVLEGRVSLLEGETERLRQEVSRMRTNPFTYEKAARERLGFGKEGEVVYDFREDPLQPQR